MKLFVMILCCRPLAFCYAYLHNGIKGFLKSNITGKSFSEALILESVNPQYDNRLFIYLRVLYKTNTNSEHVVYKHCFECQTKTMFVHNMFWTCTFLGQKQGVNQWTICSHIVECHARMNASEKDLLVIDPI